MQNHQSAVLVATLVAASLLSSASLARAADDSTKANSAKAIDLINRTSGKDTGFDDFRVDDSALQVSAASFAGVAPSAIAVAESVNDIALFVQGLDSKGNGVGISVTPARIRHPWPRVEVIDYLNGDWTARILSGISLSYAQGRAEVESSKYIRRAVALSVSGVFRIEDDPIFVLANSVGAGCGALETAKLLEIQAKRKETIAERPLTPEEQATITAALQKCIDAGAAKLNARWFRPIWAVAAATGDVRLDADGARTTSLGNAFSIAARYGQGIQTRESADKKDNPNPEYAWGWAVSGSYKTSRREPVLSSLGSPTVERQKNNLAAVRLAAGTETFRALLEASNAKREAVQSGDLTLRRAAGIDLKVREGWWLNLRYGDRDKFDGTGHERAGLLSLSISPTALWPK